MIKISIISQWIFIIAIVFVSGCSVDNVDNSNLVDDVEGYVTCPDEIGDFCIEIYQPVCGEDGVTYGNSCKACQNVERYREGACE